MMDTITRLRDALEGPNTYGSSNRFWLGLAVVLAGLLVYPQFTGGFVAANTALFLIYGFLALSLALIWGYCGILSFGQVVFFGVGGYVFGIVGINFAGPEWTIIALFAGVLAATASAAVLGYFMFYGDVRDVYVSIITLVVTLALFTFMSRTAGSEWAIGEARLGGLNGMTGIPTLAVGVSETALVLDGIALYYAVLVLLVATYLGLRVFVNSRYGRMLVAVREDEDRTEMFGYDTRRIKLGAFSFGGALGGFGGGLFASWGNFMDPSVFGITFAILPIVWVSIGGRKSLLGAIGAALAIEWVSNRLAATGSEYALIVVGVLLLGTIRFLPEGVVPRLATLVETQRQLSGQPPASDETGQSPE